jgi:hypothetical protein
MEKYGKIIDENKNGKIWKLSYFFDSTLYKMHVYGKICK